MHKLGLAGGQAMDGVLPFEQVDPLSGNLVVAATDLVLPGNAGFDLRVQRFYNSAIYPGYATGDVTLEEDSWAGIGWRLHFGRVLHPDATGSGETQIEMGDGSRQPLYTTTAFPEGWITPGLWRYNRATATLLLPNGVVYVFGRSVFINSRVGTVRYVTEIRDAFNNRVLFEYFDGSGPPDGVSRIRQILGPTQEREVTFTYDAALKSLKTMQYGNRVWQYDQEAAGSEGHSLLRFVRPPKGLPWEYEYTASAPGQELRVIRAPLGGNVTYAYGDVQHRTGAVTTLTRVVTTRTTGGRDITGGTWTFAYDQGSNQDQTWVTSPCNILRYRFIGHGLAGDFTAWSAGALAERTTESAGEVLERETFSYVRSDLISPDYVPGSEGVAASSGVFTALLSQRTVTRGTESWATAYAYHDGDGTFNDYGQPWEITESQSVYYLRETVRTFTHGFTPYIRGRIATERVRVRTAYDEASGPIFSTWSYDTVTGFLTAQNRGGLPLTFEPYANGNVAAVVDGVGNRTTYQYTWGRASEIRTAHLTSGASVNPDGTIAWEGIDDLGTTYLYDDAFRIVRATPSNTNSVIYEYDDLNGTSVSASRGSAVSSTRPDGFGRAVRSRGSDGVFVRVEYDACGRTTFQSAPYTTGDGTRGVTSTYDALGRPRTVTAPDGSVTTFTYAGLDVTVTTPMSATTSRTTTYQYKGFGAPVGERLMAVIDANGETTRYKYDVKNNLTRVEAPGVPARTWVYDDRGLLLSDTQPESGTTTYRYDTAGRRFEQTNALGEITTFHFDGDRLYWIDAPGSTDDATMTFHPVYGRVSTRTNGTVTTSWAYDTAGRLAGRTDTVGGQNFTSQLGFDASDRVTTVAYPSGRVVAYDYDTSSGRLTAVRNNGAVFADAFSYGDTGALASYRTGAVTHTVTYDNRDRVKRMTSGGATGLDLTYQYDGALDRIAEITDPRASMTQSFGYDRLDRLTAADGPFGSLRWTYYAAGDRATETHGTTTLYHYDSATNRLLSTSGAVAETFGYDALGRLTADSRGAYTYTAYSQLASATSSGMAATYSYDAGGSRLVRTVNSQTAYTIPGVGGEPLSEYQAPCGAPVWARDTVYAAGRPIGAVRANLAAPTVTLTAAAASVPEAQTSIAMGIRLTTATGAPTACPVTVGYEASAGSATAGGDFTAAAGTVVFPAGTASGSVPTITVTLIPDAIDEPDETFTLRLSTATGATLGATVTETVTIVDDDEAPHMAIEGPAAGATVKTPFVITGWAMDGTAPSGTGVDAIHVYATPSGGGAAFLGSATYGESRPAVATLYGSRFANSGFRCTASLTPGTYELAVYARSTATGTFNQAQAIAVTVAASSPQMALDAPAAGATLAQPFTLAGWAVDLPRDRGPGVDRLDVVAQPQGGGAALALGTADYGAARSDVGQTYGAPFTNSGFHHTVRGLTPGTYQLVASARSTVTGTVTQSRSVTVTVQANPQMWIDAPAPNAAVTQTVTIDGWAIDAAAGSGPGVDTIHVWAYPNPGSGAAAVFWGVATYGGTRPDVGAVFGAAFTPSGYTLTVSGLAPNTYQVVVFARSTVTGTFSQAQSVVVTVAAAQPVMAIDTPGANATVGRPFTVAGWAIDRGAPSGPGVDAIHVYAVANGGAGAATFVGVATYGGARGDLGSLYGAPFTNCGYGLSVSGLAPGTYRIDVYARSTVSGTFNQAQSVVVTVQ